MPSSKGLRSEPAHWLAPPDPRFRGRPVARIIAEPAQPAADAAAIAAELRAFVLAQPSQARTAAEVVREARDGARY